MVPTLFPPVDRYQCIVLQTHTRSHYGCALHHISMLDVPSYMELSEQPGSNVLLVVFLGYRALFMHRSIYDSFLVT